MKDLSILPTIITILDFFLLTSSLWLGFFIVTRSPRSRISWLAAASIWALSGAFLNSLIELHSPPEGIAAAWWWGWCIAVSAALLHHLSVSLLPAKLAQSRQWLIALIYLIAINLIAMEAYTPLIFDRDIQEGTLGAGQVQIGPLYPLFAMFLIAVPILSIAHLGLGLSKAISPPTRQRFKVLIRASLFFLLGAIWGSLMTWLAPELTYTISDLCLGISVVILGIGIARWNALIEGRSVKLDLLYTSLAFVAVIGLYSIAAWISYLFFGVPPLALLLMILLAIVTHSLYDWARTYIDRWILRGRRYQLLRENLWEFTRLSPIGNEPQERLRTLLENLCRMLEAPAGFAVLIEEDRLEILASIGKDIDLEAGGREHLVIESATHLIPSKEILGVPEVAMVAPLYQDKRQIGAVAVCKRASGSSYSVEDLLLLDNMSDLLTSVIQTMEHQEHSVEQIDTLLREVHQQEQSLRDRMREAMGDEDVSTILLNDSEDEAVSQVEETLRHLHDYVYLGRHTLAQLRIVDAHLKTMNLDIVTHVDRGKALKEVLESAIEKLKPTETVEQSPPPREWHAYLILHDCYVLEKLNRDVMSELYISEGTFNRTRRHALRGTTRALAEMERACT